MRKGRGQREGCGRGGDSLGEVRSPSPKERKLKATVAALDHPILFFCQNMGLFCLPDKTRSGDQEPQLVAFGFRSLGLGLRTSPKEIPP